MNQQDPDTKQQSSPQQTTQQATQQPGTPEREYEKSGLYPANGKPFRLWALLGWLTALIVVLAGVSALLNVLILGTA